MDTGDVDRNDILWGLTAILLIVNVLLLVVIGASLFDRDDPDPDLHPGASFTSDFESNGSDSVIITHDGGDDFRADNVTIVIDGAINEVTGEPYDEINGRHNVTSLGYHSGSDLGPGDTIVLNRSTLGVADGINFETAEIRVVRETTESTLTYYKWTGPAAKSAQTTSRSSR